MCGVCACVCVCVGYPPLFVFFPCLRVVECVCDCFFFGGGGAVCVRIGLFD